MMDYYYLCHSFIHNMPLFVMDYLLLDMTYRLTAPQETQGHLYMQLGEAGPFPSWTTKQYHRECFLWG